MRPQQKNKFSPAVFGKRLRTAIQLLDLDMRTAAIQIGTSHSTVSRVCNGKAPDVENYLRIIEWLGDRHEAIRSKAKQAVVGLG